MPSTRGNELGAAIYSSSAAWPKDCKELQCMLTGHTKQALGVWRHSGGQALGVWRHSDGLNVQKRGV